MKLRYKEYQFIYYQSYYFLFFFFFDKLIYFNKPFEIINFIDSDIHEDFEIEITNNLDDINNFLKEYLFIENYLLKRKIMK